MLNPNACYFVLHFYVCVDRWSLPENPPHTPSDKSESRVNPTSDCYTSDRYFTAKPLLPVEMWNCGH